MPTGNCRLCGLFGELTYEHVPPRVSFNKTTRFKIIQFKELLEGENLLKPISKAKLRQGGIGFYSLCKSCNSFLGSSYVPTYHKYCNTFVEMAGKKEYAHFQIKIHHFEAGVVLKQILSMFLSINDEGFASNNPDLRTYVADPLSTALPPKYRVFTYLNTHGQFRHLPIQASGNLLSGETIVASEIAFPPLGFVLTLDYSGKLSLLQEITHFKQASKGQFATAEVHLNRLETHLPFILDYREKHVIEAAMKSSS